MQITIHRAGSAACVCVETPDPSVDASGYAEDWAGAAALLGVSLAEARRRACRSFVDTVAAAASLPAAKEMVLRSSEDVEAEKIKERGEKKDEKKDAKKAAKAEAKAEGK